MAELPTATFAPRRRVYALASGILVVGVAWGVWHFVSVAATLTGAGNPMAVTFLVTFLLLWWVPVSWFERPFTVTDAQRRRLDDLVVAVQVPVYNEDPTALEAALRSLLAQTRLPNRVHVVDDGSLDDYAEVRDWWRHAAGAHGVVTTWTRTVNRGKRHAQMEVLADDPADVFVTLDSDSTLDRAAIEEGLKPFVDPHVTSVAGMVAVWNTRTNFLTRLTAVLYTSFTRGFRSAQSVLGSVMVNSGTLAFYRADVIREHAGSYEHETFRGRPMQMNDDSMMTFYAMLAGRTVHQPTSVAFTVVPDKLSHYLRQQLRWMRGTFIRTFWWWRYLPVTRFAWWMPTFELLQLLVAVVALPVMLVAFPSVYDLGQLALATATVGVFLNYLVTLRYFVIDRSDESLWYQVGTWLLAPVAGLWRLLLLRPLIVYAMSTFWKVGSWGTRQTVEVTS